MDFFYTMVIAACISGQSDCLREQRQEPAFTSRAACEAQIDDVTHSITKRLAHDPGMKGKQVTYDVTCYSRTELRERKILVQTAL